MEYKFPQIDRTQGYAWNAMQRIEQEVGLKPTAMGDSGGATFVNFSRDLDKQEYDILEALMAENPTIPPQSKGEVFVVKDIWSQKSDIETKMERPYRVYYSQSTPGSGKVDQIELHFDASMTPEEVDKVMAEYGNLISRK